ncbi:MAG: hypothetical protein HZY79_13065 [Rhodoblastus sp.]|nr:MAG: hypothetical protein HZY79_13065 [Rhodoblastus sp.]
MRTLGAKGGFTASSVTEGKTVIDTTYAVDGVAGRDKVIRREFSRDVLAINALKPGERRAYEVKQEDEYGERTSKQSRRAVAARAVRIGACSMEVIETEHFIDLQRGWTQTNHVLISPALDYAVQLELGPLVRGSDVRNQYSNFWRVIGFGSRDEARKLCDDFVS